MVLKKSTWMNIKYVFNRCDKIKDYPRVDH